MRQALTTHPTLHEDARTIRASEVGAYGYCAHAWWLGSVEGARPDDVRLLEYGSAVHERHGRRMIVSTALMRLAYVLLLLAGMAGVGWLISLLLG